MASPRNRLMVSPRKWGVVAGALLGISARVALAQEPAQDPNSPAPEPTEDAGIAEEDAGNPNSELAPNAALDPAVPTHSLNTTINFNVGGYTDNRGTSVLTPSLGAVIENPTAGWSVNGTYLVDMVSAASPDVVATASPNWKELRNAGNLGGKYKPGSYGIAGGATVSYTRDYLALGFNAQLIQDLAEKNFTLTEGYTFGHDVIGRTGTPFSVFARQFDYHAMNASLSTVVNPSLVVALIADLVIERGDQSKPYRYIPIFTGGAAAQVDRGASADRVAQLRIQARPLEQLPLDRERGALTGRASWRMTARSTLRLEERLYHDTWNLRSTTTDVRWLFDVSDRLMIWPHGRFHLQNGVDFWQRAYSARSVNDLPALRTGDRELSPLSNITFGGGMRLALGRRTLLGKTVDDVFLNASADATHTYFNDAMYVRDRWSVLLNSGIEVGF